jgi:exfoliative toxin A/B
MIKRIPLPIVGVMLAMATTGNLIQTYSPELRLVFGAISAIIGILLIIKFLMYPKDLLEDLKNPVAASVAPTFSMAIMLLSVYIKPFSQNVGLAVWFIGLILHCALILLFTFRFILKFDMKKVFPSYFIVYVGLVATSITAPAFNMNSVGQSIFWIGFVCYLILLAIISYRVIKVKGIPEPAQPLIIIFAAPASLCLAGYLSSFNDKSMPIVYLLIALSAIMYIFALIQLPKLLKLKFYPSYSAFTFPMAISAVAMKMTDGFLTKTGHSIAFLKYIVIIQTIIAIVLVLYVLVRYILMIVNTKQESKA